MANHNRPTCPDCDGGLDRPGLFRCDSAAHPAPTLAQRVAAAIESDLSDRRGIGQEWQSIDPETQREIRDEWAKIIARELKRCPGASAVRGRDEQAGP